MNLIKPSEVSGRILTLLDESVERVIIVSPYVKISKWYKLVNKINRLKDRGVKLEVYVRDDPGNTATYLDLDKLELAYSKIPHLHCKLYLNESWGIASSMNLLLSSEINSLEFGYATETRIEYNELLSLYHRYVHIREPIHCNSIAGEPDGDMKVIIGKIKQELIKSANNPWLWYAENRLNISTGRTNYIVSINDGLLRVTASFKVDSCKKQSMIQDSPQIIKKVGDLTAMKVDMHPCPEPNVLQLTGLAQHTLESPCLNGIMEAEVAYMMESVIEFIDTVEDLIV